MWLQGLFKAYSLLSEDYGSIHVTIGEAISVHSFCVDQGVSRVPHSLQPRYGKGLPGWPSVVGNYLSPFNELLLKVLCLFSRKSKLNLNHANAAYMGHAPPTFNHMTIFFSAHRC